MTKWEKIDGEWVRNGDDSWQKVDGKWTHPSTPSRNQSAVKYGRGRPGKRAGWTPERREAARQKALARGAQWRENNPEFMAIWNAALASGAKPCDTCGSHGTPFVDKETNTFIAWRCYRCRRAGQRWSARVALILESVA